MQSKASKDGKHGIFNMELSMEKKRSQAHS